jgi:nucleoside-diphosphate-sugar epimerase
MIRNVEQLDDVLSRPTEGDCEAVKTLGGNLLLLGVAGKMGPTLALRARRAAGVAGIDLHITAVARFSNPDVKRQLDRAGIETLTADLLDRAQVAALPEASNVVFLAARKFGATGDPSLTWAMNVLVPAAVAERYHNARIVSLSTGNVYPFVPVGSGGASECTPVNPVGEYGITALGRERAFEHFSHRYGTQVAILRLNYAIDLRYGVLLDIGQKVHEERPVDLAMGHVNVVWQGYANSVVLRSFSVAASPPYMLNLTGPETLSVRWIACRFGEHFGVKPLFTGTEAPEALLSNAARCHRLFGYPEYTPEELIEWTAKWIEAGGPVYNKPTHFQVRDGKF